MALETDILTDPEQFVSRCRPWLDRVDSPYHTILSVAHAAIDGYSAFSGSAQYGVVSERGETSGCWIQIRDGQVYLPELEIDHLRVVCEAIHQGSDAVRCVYAPKETALRFADVWSALTDEQLVPKTEWQVMFALPPISPVTGCSGHLRLAQPSDRETIEEWGHRYEHEKPAPISVVEFMLGKLQRQELHLWVDAEPVSMLATTSRMDKRARLAALYTPPEFRRKRYGSVLVSEVTQSLFNSGFVSCAIAFDTSDSHLADFYASIGFSSAEMRLDLQALDVS